MVTKGTINLYIDRELVVIAKSKQINISEICENALKEAVLTGEEIGETAEEQDKNIKLEIAKLSGRISALKAKQIGLEKQKELEWERKVGIDKGKTEQVMEYDTDES